MCVLCGAATVSDTANTFINAMSAQLLVDGCAYNSIFRFLSWLIAGWRAVKQLGASRLRTLILDSSKLYQE
jgi:hypothetical protein